MDVGKLLIMDKSLMAFLDVISIFFANANVLLKRDVWYKADTLFLEKAKAADV